MASLQLRKRLTMFVALCQLLFPLHTLPLQAQETAIQKNSDENIRTDEAVTGREGFASYYAKRYHGRRTLSGARYHPEKMTAASPDLPMGSKVTLKNFANGKEVLGAGWGMRRWGEEEEVGLGGRREGVWNRGGPHAQ